MSDPVDRLLDALTARLKERERTVLDDPSFGEVTGLQHVGVAPGLTVFALPDAETGAGSRTGSSASPQPQGPPFPDKGEIVYAMGQGSLYCASIKQVVTASGLWLYCVTPEGTTHWVRPEQVVAVNEKKGAADYAQFGGMSGRR